MKTQEIVAESVVIAEPKAASLPSKLKVCGKTYDLELIQAKVNAAQSHAGRAKSILNDLGVSKEIRELGGGHIGILTPSLISHVAKSKKMTADQIRIVKALDKLADALHELNK